jgi:hypothetical protein
VDINRRARMCSGALRIYAYIYVCMYICMYAVLCCAVLILYFMCENIVTRNNSQFCEHKNMKLCNDMQTFICRCMYDCVNGSEMDTQLTWSHMSG